MPECLAESEVAMSELGGFICRDLVARGEKNKEAHTLQRLHCYCQHGQELLLVSLCLHLKYGLLCFVMHIPR